MSTNIERAAEVIHEVQFSGVGFAEVPTATAVSLLSPLRVCW